MNPRRLAIGLARYVMENEEKEIPGDLIGPIIYRLRVVENYRSDDIDRICEAMKVIIKKLVDLPPVTYAPEVWMPLMTAISEGGLETQWIAMMEDLDVGILQKLYSKTSEDEQDEDEDHIESMPSSTKCYEQITSICKEYVLEYGLTRRVFSSIWETDLEDTMQKMMNEEWDSVKIASSKESGDRASYLLERNIFDVFSEMKDHELFAKELYYSSLARIMKRLQENKKPSADPEDLSFFESSFHVYDEIIKKLWPYLIKKDTDIKMKTMKIFEKLLSLASTKVLVQKITEKFIDTCGWLKINGDEVCAEMEPRLWKVVGSLVERLLELKKTIPYEIVSYAIAVHITQEVTLASPEDSSDHFESLNDVPINSGNATEMFLRSMVDSTRTSLETIITFLRTAKSSSDVVHFMKSFYPELVFSTETRIMNASLDLYKEAAKSIAQDDLLSIIDTIVREPAIVSIIFILNPIKDRLTSKIAVERVLIHMANDLEDENAKREGYVKHMHESGVFWNCMKRLADPIVLDKAAKRFAEVAIDSLDVRTGKLAADMFLTIIKLKLDSEEDGEPSSAVACNASFTNWNMEEDRWNQIGHKLIEVNMSTRSENTAIPLFTLKQLSCVQELPMKDLVYVVTQMKWLKSKEGIETHRIFYEKYPKFSTLLKNFQSESHQIALCKRMLEEFAKAIAANETESLIFKLDYENILEWLKNIGVLQNPIITQKLVELLFAIEIWDILVLFQLETSECDSANLQTFGRFWKTSIMAKLGDKRQKEFEEQVASLLKLFHDKEERKTTRDKRYHAKFPNRPAVENGGSQLLLMHNNIAGFLTKKRVEEFADESTDLFKWLLGVCSGQCSYSKETCNEAKKILARLYTDAEKRQQVLYHFSLSNILHGIGKTLEEKGKLVLRYFFVTVYTEIVAVDMLTWKEEDSLEKIGQRMGGLIEWLEDVTEEKLIADDGIHMTLIIQLSHHCWFQMKTRDIAELEDSNQGDVMLSVKKFAEVISSRLDSIVNWLIPTHKPFTFAGKLNNLLEVIFNFPEIVERHQKAIESCFHKIFDLFLREEYMIGLANNEDFQVQYTEKYQSSSLNYKREYFNKEPIQNKLWRVTEVLKLFCKYGSDRVQMYCLKKIEEALKTLPEKILENKDILKGNRRIEKNIEKRLVCDVTLLSELLGFFNCLHKQLSETNRNSEEIVLNAFMLMDTCHPSKGENNKRSGQSGTTRHQHDALDLHFCTFKTTGDKFTSQHWYNCFTCNMMEQTGVCSTCAVNCHRGHLIAYSKKGQFFCDCGSQGCGAMKKIDHFPNPMNSLRGQLPGDTVQKSSPKPREVFDYSFAFLKNADKSKDWKDLKRALKPVQEEFQKVHRDLEKVLEAIDHANQKALLVAKQQKTVVQSLRNMDSVVVDDKEDFMEALETAGHFLPIRRVDVMVQERLSSTPKRRELADVIKLDNGTELIVMIPDFAQPCIQLHYMDTRTHLIQGMHYLRTETEQIPFNAMSLSVSGNRLVVCGAYEIYALRFSPQGTVIDRGHIKLMENGSSSSMQSNPVKKAKFSREIEGDKTKRQLIAVATLQYIRVYDLTLHETNFVEEMVLTTGNVEDVLIMGQENGNIRILVLSSSGYLYEHIVTDGSADNNSIFLTNVVNTPGMDMNGDGVSLHYSHTYDLLFVSLDSALHVARLPDPAKPSTAPIYDWKPLNIKYPVEVWREASGIISCLPKDSPDQVVYFHPTFEKISIQKTSVNRPIMTGFLMTSSKNQAVYSVLIYPDLPTCEIWETKWNSIPDLWIEDVPSERFAVEVIEQKTAPKPLEKEDLVLMAEQCELITSVDWSCRDIEMFYTHSDLNRRLLSTNEVLPITIVQQTHFTLQARVTNSRQIVRMIRVEVEGLNGPDSLKIGNTRYSIAARNPWTFDLKLSREESLSMDHKNIQIEVIPRPIQNTIKLKSLKLYGCDRNAMDEIQPRFERQPVLTAPNRLVYSILEFPISNNVEWVKEVAENHLSRKLNHPVVCAMSTKAIVKCHPETDEFLFKVIDGAYLQEWKSLINWTEESGFTEMRTYHVEHLLERIEGVRTRWPYFYKTLKEKFGTVTSFVELMRDEMTKMPLHRCQLMAQAIVKVVFGLLSYKTDEAEELINVFLDIFTDQNTYHLANDLRSAVQETISRYENALKQEKTLINSSKKN
uniref:UBR-type domain-containing protein n=1 Tax=Caenorhabditis tropicalis TaxID=1561998 RepID=A0A1I7UEM7_9PELO